VQLSIGDRLFDFEGGRRCVGPEVVCRACRAGAATALREISSMCAHCFNWCCVCVHSLALSSPSLCLRVLACARQAMSESTMGKRGAEVKAEPDEELSAKKSSKAGARSLSNEKKLPGPNRAPGSGSKAKATTTPDGGKDASTPHIFFGFEFTTKQMAKAVSKLHLSINKDSSNETIKRLVGFSPRVCIPLSGVAFVCFHRVCDFCRAARLPLVETSSCHGVTRRFLV
jgi:hypothetical protein